MISVFLTDCFLLLAVSQPNDQFCCNFKRLLKTPILTTQPSFNLISLIINLLHAFEQRRVFFGPPDILHFILYKKSMLLKSKNNKNFHKLCLINEGQTEVAENHLALELYLSKFKVTPWDNEQISRLR